ncbi:MAG: hypothetical protein GWN33_02850 [Gammaproteobacteria bacterium]|nr:hypothetical protein [Gammaproteobacteria bacterium]
MQIEILRDLLAWCALINILLYLWWVLTFIYAHDWMFRFHSRWFNLTQERFDSIHYAGIAFYKILIIFFNLIPYVVLRILN